MKQTNDLKQFHEALNDAYYELEKEMAFPNHFYQSFLSGESEIYQKSIHETKIFHEDWIGTIESYFPSLDKITKDPKSGLKYLQEVTAIEKAKKTNSDSIRHLAANTHLIKEIREGGDVMPSKILTTQAEINYAIYENRFIKTLVDRLFDFVDQRYQIVKRHHENYENKFFNLKSNFDIQNTEIELMVDMKIKETVEDIKQTKINRDLLNRIQFLLKQVNGIRVSPFMQELKNAKPIVPPIMQTSIILKNVDYKNCYNLWLYLDKYNTLNFDVDVKEKNLTLDKYYMRNVYQTALTVFTNVYGNQKALQDHYQYLEEREYTRKSPKYVKKSLDELLTNPDPFVLEDNAINQFFLEQNKQLFSEKLDKFMDESSSYDVALRKALRDTIAISNALFNDYFDLTDKEESYDDFFLRMVKKDLDQELATAKDKARIARVIRETKEVDYNNSIRMEKRLLREIEKINKEIAKSLRKKSIEEGKKQAIEERIKLERQNLDKNQQVLTEYLEFVSEQKQMLIDESKAIQEKIKMEEKRIKAEEKRLIELEKKKAANKYKQEVKRLRSKQKKEKEKLAVDTRKKIRKEYKKLRETTEALEKKSKAKVRETKKKIQAKTEEKIDQID